MRRGALDLLRSFGRRFGRTCFHGGLVDRGLFGCRDRRLGGRRVGGLGVLRRRRCVVGAFGRGLDDRLGRLCRGLGHERRGDGWALALVHLIAERPQDGGETVAGATGERRHGDGDDKRVAIGGAGRRVAGGLAGAIGDGGPDEIGQPFENIDAHGALAADAETGGAIEAFRHRRIGDEGGAARRGEMRNLFEPLELFEAALFQSPELGCEGARRRLQQRREIEVIGAEAHAELTQAGARRLLKRLHFFGDARAFQHAERFRDLERQTARDAFKTLALLEFRERAEQLRHVLGQPEIETALDEIERGAGQLLVGENARARLQDMIAGRDLADGFAEPADNAVIGEDECVVDRLRHARGALLHLARQRFLRGGVEGLGGLAVSLRVGGEPEPVKLSHVLALDHHITGSRNFRFEHRVLSQAFHQHAGPAIDKSLRQPLMQRIRQTVLYPTRDALPMRRII